MRLRRKQERKKELESKKMKNDVNNASNKQTNTDAEKGATEQEV